MNELEQYIKNMTSMASSLSSAGRRRVMRRLSRALQKERKESIKANTHPDGSPMKKSSKGRDYLEGYRKIKSTERLPIGKEFIYDGPETTHVGEIRRMVSLKTPATDLKYGTMLREWPGGRLYNRTLYDAAYVQGFATAPRGQHGVSKFDRKYIYVKAKNGGGVKQRLMFRKINQYRFLKARADENAATVGYFGGRTARIAFAHQYGEGNRPARPLLGFSPQDLRTIEETLISHLAATDK